VVEPRRITELGPAEVDALAERAPGEVGMREVRAAVRAAKPVEDAAQEVLADRYPGQVHAVRELVKRGL
jgi:hypothetical protein